MTRQVARVEYVNGCADAYDARGVMLTRQRCDRLVGYGTREKFHYKLTAEKIARLRLEGKL